MPSGLDFNADVQRALDDLNKPVEESGVDGAMIPHHLTFSSILNVFSKTYSYRWDEAIRHLPQNALAMRRDAYIRALLQERTMPTARRKWQLDVDNPDDPHQKLCRDILTKVVKATPRFAVQRYYLMESVWYGRYGSQIVTKQKDIDGAPRWAIVSHNPVNGDKIQGGWDGVPAIFINHSFASKYPQESILFTDRVPALKLDRPEWRRQFIIHRHTVDDADYFEGEMAGGVAGVGVRHFVYWNWWLRDELLSWAVDFMKKVGTLGLLIFWYELGNKAAKDEALAASRRASKDTTLAMGRAPSGTMKETWGVERLEAGTGGIEALQGMIKDYFEAHMERLIVGQTLSAGTEGSGLGGSGVADLHADTKYQLLAFDAENLDETLTTDMVEPLKALNCPWADFPVRFKSIVPDPENDKKLEAASKVTSIGVTLKADEVREATGFTKPGENDETVGGQQPAIPGMDGMGGDASARAGGSDGANQVDLADLFHRVQRLELYQESGDGGQWVTIGGTVGADGKRHGGSPVFIRDGKIEKGHPSLVSKAPHQLRTPTKADQAVKLPDHWRQEAEEAGVSAQALHTLASEMKDHHKAVVEDRKEALKLARQMSERLGYGSLQGMALRNARGKLDAAQVRGLDDVAERVAEQYPHLFPSGEEKTDRLYDMIVEGAGAHLSDDDAFRAALDHLAEMRHRGQTRPRGRVSDNPFDDDDSVPFQYAWQPHTLKSGPRKGKQVWLNPETGEMRDEPPGQRPKDPAGQSNQDSAGPQISGDDSPIPQGLSDEAGVRSAWQKIASVFGAVKAKANHLVVSYYLKLGPVLEEEVIPTADDWSQAWAAKHLDPLLPAIGISTKDAALILSHALRRLVKRLKSQGQQPQAQQYEAGPGLWYYADDANPPARADVPDERVEALRAIMGLYVEVLGIDPSEVPDFDGLLELLDRRQACQDDEFVDLFDASFEAVHPRGPNGRFIDKGTIASAASDPEKAAAIRKTLTKENQVRFDAAVKAAKQKQPAKAKKEFTQYPGKTYIGKLADDPDELAEFLPRLSPADQERLEAELRKNRYVYRAGMKKLTSIKGRKSAADFVADVWSQDGEFRDLSDPQKAELTNSALFGGMMPDYVHEAHAKEYDGHGSLDGVKMWLDAKHHSNDSAWAVSTKDLKKKIRQSDRWKMEGRGLMVNVAFRMGGNQDDRGVYFVPGFGVGTNINYRHSKQLGEERSHPLEPVQILNAAELKRLQAGDQKMVQEFQKRTRQYLSESDVLAMEDALRGQSVEARGEIIVTAADEDFVEAKVKQVMEENPGLTKEMAMKLAKTFLGIK